MKGNSLRKVRNDWISCLQQSTNNSTFGRDNIEMLIKQDKVFFNSMSKECSQNDIMKIEWKLIEEWLKSSQISVKVKGYAVQSFVFSNDNVHNKPDWCVHT